MEKYLIKRPRTASRTENLFTESTDGVNRSDAELSEKSELKTKYPRRFHENWKKAYPWIQYNTFSDILLCSVCKEAEEKGLLSFATKREEVFINKGFRNWKKGLEKLKTHEKSVCHQEATNKIYLSKRDDINISTQMQKHLNSQKDSARNALMCIFTTLRFLARQGLAIRNCGSIQEEHTEDISTYEIEDAKPKPEKKWSEQNSNFLQCLQMRQEDSKDLCGWLVRDKKYKWLSHNIQNEILDLMANDVQRRVIKDIKTNGFFSVILDETADANRQEQICVCIRHVDKEFKIFEDFIGLYHTSATDGESLFKILKDVILRIGCDFDRCRGQCYDGASNVSGRFKGLQSRVKELQPKASYIHCCAHTLNLSVQDAIKTVPIMRNTLALVRDIVNSIRESPKRIACFATFQKEARQTKLRPLCPTRWTVKVKSIKTALSNYESLFEYFDSVASADKTDFGAKCQGFSNQLSTFSTYFALTIFVKLLEPVEEVNKNLQAPSWSVTGILSKIKVLQSSIETMRTENAFDSVWESIVLKSRDIGDGSLIEEPVVPRTRKIPKRISESIDEHLFKTPKDYYRKLYFEAVDCVLVSLKERFTASSAIKMMSDMETELLKAIDGKKIDMNALTGVYKSDFNNERLELHIKMFADYLHRKSKTIKSLHDVVNTLRTDQTLAELLTELTLWTEIMLVIPATSCSAERSFSQLRRLKSYLRTTMSQKRLNSISILQTHNTRTDELDIHSLVNEFIRCNPHRLTTFNTY